MDWLHNSLAKYQNGRFANMSLQVIFWPCMKIAGETSGPGPAKDCHNSPTESFVSNFNGTFSDPCVRAIAEDQHGNLWLARVVAASFTWNGTNPFVLNAAGAGRPLVLALHMDREGASDRHRWED